ARVRPGHRARLVDISCAGALVETHCRLLPGTSVELHVETETAQASVRGHVLRCFVVRVLPSSVSYRGAIRFDRHLPWFADEPDRPPTTTHEVRPVHPRRAPATREVI